MQSVNPATGQVLAEFQPDAPAEVERKLALAAAAFPQWRETALAERTQCLLRAAAVLEEDQARFARTMTLEMGKPIRAAIQEVEKCALACRFFAERAAEFLQPERSSSQSVRFEVRFDPLGPVLAVMPWNFPFWQVFRFAAPAVMAGNIGLLKHASNVPQCARAIAEVFHRAGFPEGVFQALLIPSAEVERVIADPRIAAVTLTGSVPAGRSVAALAGRHLKKTVLELGGSDPFIVMPSTDLERAAAVAVQARTINNGQSCIAAKRFIIDRRIFDRFAELFVEKMRQLVVGDPLCETTDIGPLATASVRDGLEAQVRETIRLGAKVVLGGQRVPGDGFFYAPSILTEIPPGSPADQDELFGPVASLYAVDGVEQALAKANDTPFGLGSSFWSNDRAEGEFFAHRIQAGLAFLNGMVVSDPRAPFGGVKHSGYGRELSRHGLFEFVNVKTVWWA